MVLSATPVHCEALHLAQADPDKQPAAVGHTQLHLTKEVVSEVAGRLVQAHVHTPDHRAVSHRHHQLIHMAAAAPPTAVVAVVPTAAVAAAPTEAAAVAPTAVVAEAVHSAAEVAVRVVASAEVEAVALVAAAVAAASEDEDKPLPHHKPSMCFKIRFI